MLELIAPAERWVKAAHALGDLPRISAALATGALSIDKVVELCRFATSRNEAGLVRWATEVSAAATRRRGDLQARRTREETEQAERERELTISYSEQGIMGELYARMPAADMAVVEQRLQDVASTIPLMPEETDRYFVRARMADALVAMCQGEAPSKPTTLLVHAPIDALELDGPSAQIGSGGVVGPSTLQRLACDAWVRMVLEDGAGNPLYLGRTRRFPSADMMRLLRYRDPECGFPGCGARAYLHAHHVDWWNHGGPTNIDEMARICSFHHNLVHEYGWRMEPADGGFS